MTSRAVSAILIASAFAIALSGCSSIKKLTGQRNDTVLPGQREEILSPDQTRAQNPAVTSGNAGQPGDGTATAPCDPTVQDCPANIDQEAGTEG